MSGRKCNDNNNNKIKKKQKTSSLRDENCFNLRSIIKVCRRREGGMEGGREG